MCELNNQGQQYEFQDRKLCKNTIINGSNNDKTNQYNQHICNHGRQIKICIPLYQHRWTNEFHVWQQNDEQVCDQNAIE